MDNQHFNYKNDTCQDLANKGYIAGCLSAIEIPNYPLEFLESDVFLEAYLKGVKDSLRDKISQMTIKQHWLDG